MMPRQGAGLCNLVAAALVATAVSAEDLPAALGRITYGRIPKPGAAICSGVLVAPDLVLTAGHCVRTALSDPGILRFEMDWRTGRPAALAQGREVFGGLLQQVRRGGIGRNSGEVRQSRPSSGAQL